MIKDITIGQYFIGKSFVHKMDARMKILLTFAIIIAIFICKSFPSLILCVAFSAFLVILAGIPFKTVIKSVKPIAIIVVFTGLLNLFYVTGGTKLVDFHFIHITSKGVYTAVFMAVRIICLVVVSSLLTYTTTPTMLTDAIEKLLYPLKLLKVPVHSLAMMMTLALRFIPTLIDEIDRITSAQKARGADLDTGGLRKKINAVIPIIVPLFVSSIRRAYELADAMDCRCYVGGAGRTRMKQMRFTYRDFIALFSVIVIIAAIILLNIFFKKVI